jgi:hypothetical protein
LGQIHLPHFAVLSHVGNAKLFENNAKEFIRQKKPLASGGLKRILLSEPFPKT